METIKNRLLKNFEKISKWASKHQIEAFRIYDRDIPEYPFILDFYKNHFVIYDKSSPYIERDKLHFEYFLKAISIIWGEKAPVFIKQRKKQEGTEQYEKLKNDKVELTIQEGKAQFLVNLSDYLDTGLFLDHRPLRYHVFKKSKNKKVLNLFCYTGAFSVLAALGGATTFSVDMSKNYMEWCKNNFLLNNLPLNEHHFLCEDIFKAFNQINDTFDIIILDPPTFSNSKKMDSAFEVEEDQTLLIEKVTKWLKPDGVLYFSNNKRKFKLETSIIEKYSVRNITSETIPIDFHDQKIHHCFEIRNKLSFTS
ncbi:MAG: class I SAM-dependent methyltransferase [Bdellovibrionaceae bacterium]|nr:class I SAM-dependent methyltransferase [Pseudobdellovibrionaceae bacterium]NUM58854.1 class I SAM-dependent methyltransferase [Pseudobdellovibrionaceae bacterium]